MNFLFGKTDQLVDFENIADIPLFHIFIGVSIILRVPHKGRRVTHSRKSIFTRKFPLNHSGQ